MPETTEATESPAVRQPVSNTERRQRVIDEIKRRIVLGEIRPGQRIIEAELTSSLEVSRPTVREALNQMARDGFLIQEAYRGLRVADIHVDSLLEIARVRVALDTEAINEILADDTGRRMAVLERSWEEFESVGDGSEPLALHEAHIRFHRGVWEAAENYLLMRIWPVVEAQMTIVLAYDQFTRRDIRRAHAVHEALMEAIRSRDTDRIQDALRAHTVDSAEELARLVSAGAPGH
ncbi:GntR family transcriptional regulator [Brevibacterium sanguinis]|uniref:GntR family transcriptional regulator n=2 Tax=Brevibacterium TaxID=1696 RepID=A0A366IME0_9MICO|nr:MULTISPECIES: GntR family transcriptional regulator [Brevibacterium]RBP65729.1 GntR family transcriptional regulator [Brevibacterium sanguinis]RBP72363.1 GntR family transcriptional regulator [Brevibacterium celere]